MALATSFRTRIHSPKFPLFKTPPISPRLVPITAAPPLRRRQPLASSAPAKPTAIAEPSDFKIMEAKSTPDERSRVLIVGAVSVGVALFLMGCDAKTASAFGPEGPLVEEFWDNVRRYAIYAVTVSTGALYTIFLPIFELLRNPISALLVLAIFAGGIFIVSQVLSAMVGVSEFPYDYAY